MGMGTPAQQQLGQKFFGPFFHWTDDTKLREWLREQDPDELEQFLNWFDFTNHRDRETLGRQELRKLRNPITKPAAEGMGMADQEFSEEGRRVRFAQWEKLGLDRIKADLQADPYARIGSGAVQKLAWEWVGMKKEESELMEIARNSPAAQPGLQQPTDAARAVYAAIQALVTAGKRAYAQNVPLTAARILVQQGAGTISQADANEQTRHAIVELSASGKIETPLEPYKDWIIKEALEVAKAATLPDKVFIVHGHDRAPKAEVARFIEKLGFQAIILHERPNKGRTIITKFREEAADVGFAVVLMTPDDHGGKSGESTNPRARQNVVFELGFFIGSLGPERVAAIVSGSLERPSDFDGVVYIDFDAAGAWQNALGRELQAAGFKVDWNRLMAP